MAKRVAKNHQFVSAGNVVVVIAAALYPLGSFVSIYSSAFSATNIITVVVLPFALMAFARAVLDKTISYGLLALVALVVLSSICVLIDPVDTNAKLLRGTIVGAAGAYGAVWICENRPKLVDNCIGSAVLLTMAIAVAQTTYLVYGVGLNPYPDGPQNPAVGLIVGIPSTFGNPNDFSVFLLLILVCCLWRNGRFAAIVRIVCVIGIVLSGSKLAFLLGLFGFFFGTFKRFLFAFIPAVAVVSLLITKWWGLLEIYAIERLVLEGELIIDGSLPTEGSMGVRLSSIQYFIQNFPEFLVGSFSAANAYPQFQDAPFDHSLISVNPHSALIELAALFGVFGLMIFLLLSVSALNRMRASGYRAHKLWFSFLSIVGASFIPSSVLFGGWFFGVAAFVVSWTLVEPDTRLAI